jgi:hypothetical protein
MALVRTTDPAFMRNTRNGTLLNTDTEAAAMYRAERERLQEMASVQKKVSRIEQDMQEMKHMLSQLLQTLNGNK